MADMSASSSSRPLTTHALQQFKRDGRKIVMITAYDYAWATFAERAGADVLLVGDSLGMVVQGRSTTLGVTLDQITYHAEMVARASRRALVVADMPFPVNLSAPADVVRDAARVLKDSGCPAVKVEGGCAAEPVIEALTQSGVATMGHIGLRPQSVHQLGGFRIQRDSDALMADALAVQRAGAFAVVVECVPSAIGAEISAELSIPTIGIGAGPGCDGQVLVLHDMLGMTPGRTPRFAKQYADLGAAAVGALETFTAEVRDGKFPSREYEMQ